MLINLKHKRLDLYQLVRELVKEVYAVSLRFPQEERLNIVQQVRRAALSVKLNLAEASTRKSLVERKRFYEVSRNALLELDAALETAVDLKYCKADDLNPLSQLMNRCFAMLSK